MLGRRLVLVGLLAAACGGPATRLVTVRSATGQGSVDFSVKNLTDVPINTFYLAKTEQVAAHGVHLADANTPESEALWGADLTGGAIPVGKAEPITVPSPGRWDARAVDRNGREQFITGLHLDAGGKYILELYEGNWRVYSP